jgi:hypothetical protein
MASCLLFKGHFQLVPFTLMEVPTIKVYFSKIYCRMTSKIHVLNDIYDIFNFHWVATRWQ